jgi:group II intron reverse transcriptase/maturase
LSDKGKTFPDLFNLVCDRRMLMHAWQRLADNARSNTPGTDGLTRRKIQERAGGVAGFLEEVHKEIKEGTYRPEPVRQRLIPKPTRPGQFRPLGIPTLKDRPVQMALKYILEPIFEADFYPASSGFRRGRNAHDALAAVIKQLHPTNHGPSPVAFVIEGDIKGCFDAIDPHRLMDRVRRRIGDRKVLRLLRVFLKADVLIEGAVRHPVTGTPQGGVMSPLLANIYLTSLDERYGRWTPQPGEPPANTVSRRLRDRRLGKLTFYMVRYADDFVLLATGSRVEVEAERDALARFLGEELRLELSKEKTLITSPQDGFVLGYGVVQAKSYLKVRLVGNLRIPKEKLNDLWQEIKERTDRATIGRSLKEQIWTLNPLIVGWRTYFQYATDAYREFHNLDEWLWKRILRWLKKKHRKVWLLGTAYTLLGGVNCPFAGSLARREGATSAVLRWRDKTLPQSRHPNTERMECRARRVVPLRNHRRVLGGLPRHGNHEHYPQRVSCA